jgi:hypothetical protein
MRLRRRDIVSGTILYEDKETKVQYLKKVKEHLKEFVLVRPTRIEKVSVYTGEVNEDNEPIVEIKEKPVTQTYLEQLSSTYSTYNVRTDYCIEDKDNCELPLSNSVEEDYDEVPIDLDDEDDCFRYLFMGSQQWIVYAVDDPKHLFRKEIRFRMGNSFAVEALKKKERALKRLENGFPDIDSAAYRDYKNKKNKKVLKNYGTDDFIYF